jgi:hypothetical protein
MEVMATVGSTALFAELSRSSYGTRYHGVINLEQAVPERWQGNDTRVETQ